MTSRSGLPNVTCLTCHGERSMRSPYWGNAFPGENKKNLRRSLVSQRQLRAMRDFLKRCCSHGHYRGAPYECAGVLRNTVLFVAVMAVPRWVVLGAETGRDLE